MQSNSDSDSETTNEPSKTNLQEQPIGPQCSIRCLRNSKKKETFNYETDSFFTENWELLPHICCLLFASLMAAGNDWRRLPGQIKMHIMSHEAHLLTSAEESHWPQTLHQLPLRELPICISSRQRWQPAQKFCSNL